jgi:hypothetical protein
LPTRRNNAEGYGVKPTLKRTGVAVSTTLFLLTGSPDCWQVERRWATGASARVMAESGVKARLAVSPSYASSR